MQDNQPKSFQGDVRSEIQSMRVDIFSQLQLIQKALAGLNSNDHSSLNTPVLKVYFSKSGKVRKPYTVTFAGDWSASYNLSTVRTAIFITLLLDLQERAEGGSGVPEIPETIFRLAKEIEPNTNAAPHSEESIRAAFYRFEIFWKENKIQTTSEIRLVLNSKSLRFDLLDAQKKLFSNNADIEVCSNVPIISNILNNLLHRSPLATVRKFKAMYIEPGRDRYDRLLFELFDHSYPMSSATLTSRFSSISYPYDLLERLEASDYLLRRAELANAALESGRYRFTEVLHERVIEKMFQKSPSGNFDLYAPDTSKDDVIGHLDYLIDKIERFENYELVLTKSDFPFYLGTWEIASEPIPERFAFFVRYHGDGYLHPSGCFMFKDRALSQSIDDRIIAWTLASPDSVRDRKAVQERLKQAKALLLRSA